MVEKEDCGEIYLRMKDGAIFVVVTLGFVQYLVSGLQITSRLLRRKKNTKAINPPLRQRNGMLLVQSYIAE
jgi:hypothetical protein